MLGYTLEDVESMKDALMRAKNAIKGKEDQELLGQAFDLLDGLIAEGHIESEDEE